MTHINLDLSKNSYLTPHIYISFDENCAVSPKAGHFSPACAKFANPGIKQAKNKLQEA